MEVCISIQNGINKVFSENVQNKQKNPQEVQILTSAMLKQNIGRSMFKTLGSRNYDPKIAYHSVVKQLSETKQRSL